MGSIFMMIDLSNFVSKLCCWLTTCPYPRLPSHILSFELIILCVSTGTPPSLAKKSWETNIGISGHIWRWIGIGSLYHFHLTNWHSLSSKVRCWLFVHRKLFWNWSLHPQLCWFKTFRFNLHWIWSNQPPTPSLLEAHTFHVFQMCVINSVILWNTLFLAS